MRQSSKPKGVKIGETQPAITARITHLRVFNRIELKIKSLQEPNNNGSHKDHSKSALQESLLLYPKAKALHFLRRAYGSWGNSITKGTASPLKIVFFMRVAQKHSYNNTQQIKADHNESAFTRGKKLRQKRHK